MFAWSWLHWNLKFRGHFLFRSMSREVQLITFVEHTRDTLRQAKCKAPRCRLPLQWLASAQNCGPHGPRAIQLLLVSVAASGMCVLRLRSLRLANWIRREITAAEGIGYQKRGKNLGSVRDRERDELISAESKRTSIILIIIVIVMIIITFMEK